MATTGSEATDPAATGSQPSPVDAASRPAVSDEKPLPKLSDMEFRQYNRLAEHMDYFHNGFRATWNTLYSACEAQKRPRGTSIKQFIGIGQQFCHHLTVHHTIEEKHIFPVLAKKMPAFRKELELLTQHKQIHNGLDKFEKYLEECVDGERELRMSEMKDILDTFGTVLWQHLDDEVKQLGAENMRKYWTIEEIRRIPM
jgi:hemerythrin-like domain-containing protein